jgi:hypothetical protein
VDFECSHHKKWVGEVIHILTYFKTCYTQFKYIQFLSIKDIFKVKIKQTLDAIFMAF